MHVQPQTLAVWQTTRRYNVPLAKIHAGFSTAAPIWMHGLTPALSTASGTTTREHEKSPEIAGGKPGRAKSLAAMKSNGASRSKQAGRASGNGRCSKRRFSIKPEKCYPPVESRQDYSAEWVPIDSIRPSPENIDIYGEVQDDDQMDQLRESIRHRGLEEPILVSSDGFILSGHRRQHGCRHNGWTHVPIGKAEQHYPQRGTTEFHRELIEYNPQRIKSVGSLLREALLRGQRLGRHLCCH